MPQHRKSQGVHWRASILSTPGTSRFSAVRVFRVFSIILCSVTCTFCARPLTELQPNAYAAQDVAAIFRSYDKHSDRHFRPATDDRRQFLSEAYNHFEGGKLFTDVKEGLDVMWRASFRYGKPYKENLGFILPHGILIIPNKKNTLTSAALSAYPKWAENGKLLLLYNGTIHEVLAIVHTHPQRAMPKPAPLYDFQFGFMGIHNFVISHHHIYDAWKDKNGNEVFRIIGKRMEYERLVAAVRK